MRRSVLYRRYLHYLRNEKKRLGRLMNDNRHGLKSVSAAERQERILEYQDLEVKRDLVKAEITHAEYIIKRSNDAESRWAERAKYHTYTGGTRGPQQTPQ